MDENRKQLATFLLLTFLLSAVFYTLIIKSGHLASGGGSYVLSLMWCPAVAAMLTCKLFGRDLGTLGWKWGETRYQVMSYCIPLLYATITYAVVWLTRLGGFYDHEFVSGVAKRFGLGPMPDAVAIVLYLFFASLVSVFQSFVDVRQPPFVVVVALYWCFVCAYSKSGVIVRVAHVRHRSTHSFYSTYHSIVSVPYPTN